MNPNVLVAIIGALALVAGAYLTYRGVKASAEAQAATAKAAAQVETAKVTAQTAAADSSQLDAFTSRLLERLESVETRLAQVEEKLNLSQRALIAAVRFIDRLVDWGRAGGAATLKMPTPSPELHEYLDPTMWDASAPQGAAKA